MSLPSLRAVVLAGVLVLGFGLRTECAQAATINFENLPAGTVVSNQYSPLGVTFSPNAFSGPGTSSSGQPWATNTGMTIANSAGGDVAGLGTPALVNGNLLHSLTDWEFENGDPSFLITFSPPVTSFSATFAGVSALGGPDVRLFIYSGATLLGTLPGPASTTGQFVLSFANPNITSVAVAPGSYNNWVGVDNITFTPAATSPTLVISEFRLRGLNGVNDEYVEIYNNGPLPHTVAAISGTGYGVAASDGAVRCTIPNGTVIPKAGHFLCANSIGYSIGGYPSGSGDATFTADIPDNAGIALFNNNSGGGSFTLANRLDAVGSTAEANTLYKEGTGYPALTPFNIDYAWVRDQCGKGGAVNLLGPCTTSSPIDTNNNAADFFFVDNNGTSAGGGQRLGTPGPQGLGSPFSGGALVATQPLDSTVLLVAPNVVRDFTSDPPNNSTFGTISIRKRFVNNTGAALTRLRFRVVDIDTFPAASGFADLRTRTSSAVVVAGINDAATCAATGVPAAPPCSVTVQGTTLEQPPSQPNGGGFNATFSADTVTSATPLANGASIDLQFLFGIQQTGDYRVGMIAEGLPAGGDVFMVTCNTDTPCGGAGLQSAVSRKVHGAVGTFDLPLTVVAAPGINHNPTTDPRQGPTHTVVLTFDRLINGATGAITEGTAAIGVLSFSGNSVIVPLTGVTDAQYVTVSLSNVAGTDGSTGGVGSVRVGFLAGDVNQTRVVSVADLGLVNAQVAQPVTGANYLKDVNASGAISVADKGITNANLTHALPTP